MMICDKHNSILILVILTYIMVASVSAGYAWLLGKPDREIIRDRAEKYWNSKLTGDMITCYQLEEPGFRKKVPVSIYARTGTLIYKEVKIKEVSHSGNNATVTVEIKYIIPAFGSSHVFSTEVKDKWKKIDNTWFHVMENKGPITRNNTNHQERR